MFNISLSPKKSILCIFLLTVLSACSANSQSGKNDAELNFEWYDTKQEADEALARFVKPAMPVNEVIAILNKSGFKCDKQRFVNVKEHEEQKREILNGIQEDEKERVRENQTELGIVTKYYQDTWNRDFPQLDFYEIDCSDSKSIDFLAGLIWDVRLIIEAEDKEHLWGITSAFNYRYP